MQTDLGRGQDPVEAGCSGELEGEEALICEYSWLAQGAYLLSGTWNQLGLFLCAHLKGNGDHMLAHSVKALGSPAATLLFPVSTRLTRQWMPFLVSSECFVAPVLCLLGSSSVDNMAVRLGAAGQSEESVTKT